MVKNQGLLFEGQITVFAVGTLQHLLKVGVEAGVVDGLGEMLGWEAGWAGERSKDSGDLRMDGRDHGGISEMGTRVWQLALQKPPPSRSVVGWKVMRVSVGKVTGLNTNVRWQHLEGW